MQHNNIAPLDFMLVRTITCLVIHGICCILYNQTPKYPTEDKLWIVARNCGGTVTVLSLFYGIKFLPIGVFQILYNTAPFWASLLGFIFLNERLKFVEVVAMITSFLLIIIIAYEDQKMKVGPTIIAHEFKNHQPTTNNISQVQAVGIFFGVASAVGASVAAVATRKMQ